VSTRREGELFGDEPIEKLLKENADKSAREIVETIMNAVRTFESPGEPADDKTIVVMKRLPYLT